MPWREARVLLENLTPLRTDCGKVCGSACCKSLDAEETGMLLFPGEEDEYDLLPEWRLKQTPSGVLAICPGECERASRPLACRMFPLLPTLREDGVHVAVDARARAVCPLARQGKNAMDAAFVQAVRKAGEALAEDPVQRTFLQRLTESQDEWNALRKKLRGQ